MKEGMGSKQILRLLFWETTIRCNLSCAHCRRLETDEASIKDLTTVQAKDLIEQLAELGKSQLKERLTAESAENADKKEINKNNFSAGSAVKQFLMPILVFLHPIFLLVRG